MKLSFQFRIFFAFACLVFIANLLLTNDYTTLWNGAESQLLLAAQEGLPSTALFPKIKIASLLQIFGFQEFMLRLPAVVITLLSLGGFFVFGKRIFGQRTTLVTILVLMSSLALPNLSKWATGDAWLFGAQLLSVVSLILYLKKPEKSTAVWHWIFVLIGSFSNALSMILFLAPLWLYYYLRHPQGEKLKTIPSFVVPIIAFLLMFFLAGEQQSVIGTIVAPFAISPKDFSLVALLGILPWLAFVPAALVDLFGKLKRKEEMSILIAGWLIGGLLSWSLGLQAALAFLVAKQVEAYFQDNYPYTNWVKTFAALNIIVAFVGGIALMLNGFYVLEAEGFRLGMSIGAVYWIPAFLGVVGVFGKNNRLITGGMAMSGLLLTFFFWARGGFVLEQFRNMPQQLTEAAAAKGKTGDLYYLTSEEIPQNYLVYGKQKFQSVRQLQVSDLDANRPEPKDVLIYADSMPAQIKLRPGALIDTVQGRNLNLETETWLIRLYE